LKKHNQPLVQLQQGNILLKKKQQEEITWLLRCGGGCSSGAGMSSGLLLKGFVLSCRLPFVSLSITFLFLTFIGLF